MGTSFRCNAEQWLPWIPLTNHNQHLSTQEISEIVARKPCTHSEKHFKFVNKRLHFRSYFPFYFCCLISDETLRLVFDLSLEKFLRQLKFLGPKTNIQIRSDNFIVKDAYSCG